MKKKLLKATLIFIFSSYLYANDLNEPYSPTKAEWLELSTYKSINEVISLWKLQTTISTKYLYKENSLIVTITTKNGEEIPTKKVQDEYISIINSIVKTDLKKYNWANDVIIKIQFI